MYKCSYVSLVNSTVGSYLLWPTGRFRVSLRVREDVCRNAWLGSLKACCTVLSYRVGVYWSTLPTRPLAAYRVTVFLNELFFLTQHKVFPKRIYISRSEWEKTHQWMDKSKAFWMSTTFLYTVSLTHTECGYNRPDILDKSLKPCQGKIPVSLIKQYY